MAKKQEIMWIWRQETPEIPDRLMELLREEGVVE